MSLSTYAFHHRLDSRDTIGLEELQEEASFLTRKDRKYLVPAHLLHDVIGQMDTDARVLQIGGRTTFRYESAYFDTDDLRSYYAALRRRPDRFKVRIRSYCDSGLSFLEAKTRTPRGHTIKERKDRYGDVSLDLSDDERAWLAEFDQIGADADRLRYSVQTTYDRSTLVLPESEGRVTIDHNLSFTGADGTAVATPGVCILETKGVGRPTSADRVLWSFGIRPVSISKFGCGMSLLAPELPANRWHRIRQQLPSYDDLALSAD